MTSRIALAAALLVATASSAALAADEDSAAWGILSAAGRIEPGGQTSPWRYSFATQWRHFDRGSGADQYLLRSSLGYDLNPRMSLWLGYDFFHTDPDGGLSRDEHRFWQQFQWSALRWEWGSLSLRTRLEERNLERADDLGFRLRQQVLLAVPLPAQDVTLIGSTEHFTNLKDTDYGARSGFDQLRSYLGVRMPMSERAALEAGYMHQWIKRGGVPDAVNHTAMLHLQLRF